MKFFVEGVLQKTVTVKTDAHISITKKEVKNSVKKVKKNPKKQLPVGLQVAQGNYTIDFD